MIATDQHRSKFTWKGTDLDERTRIAGGTGPDSFVELGSPQGHLILDDPSRSGEWRRFPYLWTPWLLSYLSLHHCFESALSKN